MTANTVYKIRAYMAQAAEQEKIVIPPLGIGKLDELNAHLQAGNQAVIRTSLKIIKLGKKHIGWIQQDKRGDYLAVSSQYVFYPTLLFSDWYE